MKDDKRKQKRRKHRRRRRIMRVTVDVDLGDSSRTPSRDEEDNSSTGESEISGPGPGPSGGTAAPANGVAEERGHQEDETQRAVEDITEDPEAGAIEYIEVPEGEVDNDAEVAPEGEAEVDVEADAEHEGRPPQPSVVEPRQPASNPDQQQWVRVRARLSTWDLACDSHCGRVCSARRQKRN